MCLNIYNSLTNKKELFIPKKDKLVNLYVCGPTVYNSIHIGNARPVVFFDMFSRYLSYLGYKVKTATNITDVDDKIINKAIELNVTESDVSIKHANNFLKNVEELNCLKFDYVPYATNYINEMINLINELIKKDYAYVVDGDVYFRVNKSVNYGVLSNQKVEELNNGVRIVNNTNKENPTDFTLWKKTDKGINWDAGYSKGRPGWHTECVCMINSIFEDGLDVHGGGFDLKFPHHENEIAQYKAMYDKDLSKYFMHVGRLDFQGQKMSKSIGNMILVDDLRKDNSFMAFKLLVLMHNYRGQINFSEELFDEYKKEFEKIERTYKQANIHLDINFVNDKEINEEYMNEFKKQMNDDFNTPNVYTLIQKMVKELNITTRNKENDKVSCLVNTLNKIFNIIGIALEYNKMSKENIDVYNEWIDARNNKDFAQADIYRNILVENGVL